MRNKENREIAEEANKELEKCLGELKKDAELFDLNGAEYISDFHDPVTINGSRYHTHALLIHVKC